MSESSYTLSTFFKALGASTMIAASSFFAYHGLKQKRTHKSKARTVRVAGLELGGTGCSVAIGEKTYDEQGKVIDAKVHMRQKVETRTPEVTLEELMGFLKDQ